VRERDSSTQAARVVLESIERDRGAALDRLFQLYAHDFGERVPLELKDSGRFDVSAGELWWSRADHHPFFVRVEGRLAGFALVRRGSKLDGDAEVMDVAEFFIVRGERRKGVGRQAVRALLDRFPGRWQVRVRQSNPPALQFWSRVLKDEGAREVARSTFSEHQVEWHVLRVEAR
jgi:predicted acetyltransferase